jgi:WXXGXW repeat (2 copies)
MLNRLKKLHCSAVLPQGIVWVVSAATLLGGCVAQVRVATPPPPRVYVAPPPPPPPPPAYGAPAVDVEVQANEPPPPLPDYEQPPCPEEGYLWTPGYWAFGSGGYFWVPGTWVQPPQVGVLWTPGYWGFVGGVYAFHAGYWGPHVGFYGGVNYGFGYGGVGFAGGRWVGSSFSYNQSVTRINVTVIHNTYNQTVINNNVTVNRVSFNGGAGGIAATPTPQERMAAQERHVAPTPMQQQHIQQAARNPALGAKANGGHPSVAATARPGAFNGPGVVGARGAATPAPHAAATAPHPAPAANGNHGAGAPFAANHPNGAAHPPAANGKPPAPQSKAANPHPKNPPQNKKNEPEK